MFVSKPSGWAVVFGGWGSVFSWSGRVVDERLPDRSQKKKTGLLQPRPESDGLLLRASFDSSPDV